VIWSSLLGGVGVSVLFSYVILGWSRAADARHEGQGRVAAAYGALSIVAMLVFTAGVVVGVTIMLRK
jgi:drug/metabolite transporter superfamily protein YnfA